MEPQRSVPEVEKVSKALREEAASLRVHMAALREADRQILDAIRETLEEARCLSRSATGRASPVADPRQQAARPSRRRDPPRSQG